jgi:hypothetical protein
VRVVRAVRVLVRALVRVVVRMMRVVGIVVKVHVLSSVGLLGESSSRGSLWHSIETSVGKARKP